MVGQSPARMVLARSPDSMELVISTQRTTLDQALGWNGKLPGGFRGSGAAEWMKQESVLGTRRRGRCSFLFFICF